MQNLSTSKYYNVYITDGRLKQFRCLSPLFTEALQRGTVFAFAAPRVCIHTGVLVILISTLLYLFLLLRLDFLAKT